MDTTQPKQQTEESPNDIDLEALTELVWELLQADLQIEQERRGERGTGRR